jgi:hypothetical protein
LSDLSNPPLSDPAHSHPPIGVPPPPDSPGSVAVSAPIGTAPMSLDASAALVGEYRWIEHALYRLLGEWVDDMPIAAVQVHLDAQSMRHAWHAELWADRLPVLAGADPDGWTAPSAPTTALFAALSGEPPPAPGTGSPWPAGGEEAMGHPGALPRLAGLYRVVLPRLVTTYERHLRVVSSMTDAPVARALRLVLNDEVEDWHAGERMVERLVSRPHDVVAVYEFLQRLEAVVVGAGATSGLVAVPGPVPGD